MVYKSFIIFAGTPATTQLSGMSFVTTAPAATITLFPIFISPMTIAPAQIFTLLPIDGFASPLSSLLPIVTERSLRKD